MTFSSFVDFQAHLDGLGLFSMQLGLSRMHGAMARLGLGRPGRTVAHVVGTNGKGSTSGFLEALARGHGLKTGLYTSPHLVSVRERIRVEGRMLPEARWLAAANAVMGACDDVGLTYFELLTVMALRIFAEENLDLVVLEAGLGGTHDATCAVAADLAVMTPVGMDHEHVLGPALADIARDKAGALGRCPAVSGLQTPEVADIFRRVSADGDFQRLEEFRMPDGYLIPAEPEPFALTPAHLPELPPYQLENAALALLAWSRLARTGGWQFDAGVCTQVLGRTRFSGRFRRHGRVLVDGAHNPMGLTALCEALEGAGERFDRLVFQAMRDKSQDPDILARLRRLAGEVVIPRLDLDRACDPQELAASFGPGARVAPSLASALETDGPVLVCGSLYLVGAYYELHPEHLEP
jgi:dihydrofolate synthase/folylpolyglutamate synthase